MCAGEEYRVRCVCAGDGEQDEGCVCAGDDVSVCVLVRSTG